LVLKKAYLKDSQLFDVIEFGRAVHAEMAAISQAARTGTSVQGGRLFCTTFPCHICARHIVAAGVSEVVFIEPYEKSRALELFSDSISVDGTTSTTNRTNFKPFVGVAPRRYLDFFEMRGRRKSSDGKILDFNERSAEPPIRASVFACVYEETFAIERIPVRPVSA
jgi:deoxycytidylate deaminase